MLMLIDNSMYSTTQSTVALACRYHEKPCAVATPHWELQEQHGPQPHTAHAQRHASAVPWMAPTQLSTSAMIPSAKLLCSASSAPVAAHCRAASERSERLLIICLSGGGVKNPAA